MSSRPAPFRPKIGRLVVFASDANGQSRPLAIRFWVLAPKS